ncbi:ParM/StbA family protein [Thiomonas sp. FB-Cd]|uniref:ParM/StbA family protein n=1 Tax=Thiomonas sp. FB-Cd TaxID=1158292 RepID=UPI0004DF0E0B|nr:ParM/StbA family protein [Thiomonas sp. FB-Cd]
MTAVGIDIGRSGVKIAGPRARVPIFPALACPAVAVEPGPERQRAEHDTVQVDGQAWFVGESAQIHGGATNSTYAGFEASPQYVALAEAALRRATEADGVAPKRIVVGVPSEAGHTERARVESTWRRIAPHAALRVVAQPAGALIAAASDHPRLLEETVIVADVGQYSSDLVISAQGRPMAGSFVSLPGVRFAVQHLAAALRERLVGSPTHDALERALRDGRLPHLLKVHDVHDEAKAAVAAMTALIRAGIQRLMTARQDVQVLLLAGGGAPLLDLDLPSLTAPGGRYAVANGFAMIAQDL